MAAVQPVNTITFVIGTPGAATFTVTAGDLGGNTRYLITGGTFTANGQKQFVDPSYIGIWRNLGGPEAVAAKLATPVGLGWNVPMDNGALLQAGTAYSIEALLNQSYTSLTNVFLELLVYP